MCLMTCAVHTKFLFVEIVSFVVVFFLCVFFLVSCRKCFTEHRLLYVKTRHMRTRFYILYNKIVMFEEVTDLDRFFRKFLYI